MYAQPPTQRGCRTDQPGWARVSSRVARCSLRRSVDQILGTSAFPVACEACSVCDAAPLLRRSMSLYANQAAGGAKPKVAPMTWDDKGWDDEEEGGDG